MSGKTLDIEHAMSADTLATRIANTWLKWDQMRRTRMEQWKEVRKYIYATDTSQTTNSTLPWKNTTTTPKLCQLRDNLFANYMAALLPKRKFLDWEADREEEDTKKKRDAIKNYMYWSIENSGYKNTLRKCLYDHLDTGDAFGTVRWHDGRVETNTEIKNGYVGPEFVRISPYDIVFDPTASSFDKTPKIIRSVVQFGEVKKELDKMSSSPEDKESAEALFEYLKEIRKPTHHEGGDLSEKDEMYSLDGFTSFRDYLNSGYAEILTFYGDIYDVDSGELYENYIIKVVDRHKILYKKANDSSFGHAPIFKVGWRLRQDNLWSMGPFDNLVGLQYRIDHIENMKADLMDLTTFPPLKIKGYVEDFDWGPLERIYVGDDGDVEIMSPDVQILQANLEIQRIIDLMEEMAGAPKEAMGFRTPGEKTMYEVQRLENASSRIFTSKILQIEEQFVELSLNYMLELARRLMVPTDIRVNIDDEEFPRTEFASLTKEDITGIGRLRPRGARHFAEKAEMVQNLNNFFNSQIGADEEIKSHFSSIKMAKMFEDILELKDYKIVSPFIRIAERSEMQQLSNVHEEQNAMAAMTPSGLEEDDVDGPIPQEPAPTS